MWPSRATAVAQALLLTLTVADAAAAAPSVVRPDPPDCHAQSAVVSYEPPGGTPAGAPGQLILNKVRAYVRDIAATDRRWESSPAMSGSASMPITQPNVTRCGSALRDAAVAGYRRYVRGRAEAVVRRLDRLAVEVDADRLDRAQRRYAGARVAWSTIEPVAGRLGDPAWLRIERALSDAAARPGLRSAVEGVAAQVRVVQRRSSSVDMDVVLIGTTARRLIDEVVSGRLTGAEDQPSDATLALVAAAIDGAAHAYTAVRPLVSDDVLLGRLDAAFAAVRKELAEHLAGTGYVPYSAVGALERRDLARVVDGLGEPLSLLAAAAA